MVAWAEPCRVCLQIKHQFQALLLCMGHHPLCCSPNFVPTHLFPPACLPAHPFLAPDSVWPRQVHCPHPPSSLHALSALQFGFIKCTSHEGRYFFHVNDSDGQAAYGSTVRQAAVKQLVGGWGRGL